MDIPKYLQDLVSGAEAAQKSIQSASLASAGWDMHQFDKKSLNGPQAFYYVYDVAADWAWSVSVPVSSAKDLSSKVKAAPAEWEIIRNELGQFIFELLKADPSSLKSTEWEESLATLSVSYAATTKTLEIHGEPDEQLHFIIINYQEDRKDSGSMLRPVLYPLESKRIMEVETFYDVIEAAIKHDKAANPDWLKGVTIKRNF